MAAGHDHDPNVEWISVDAAQEVLQHDQCWAGTIRIDRRPHALCHHPLPDPDTFGSYDQLLRSEPLPGDEPPEVWRGCLRAWALAKLHRGEHRFGMYVAAVAPADERGRPDDEKREELVGQDVDPVQ